MESYTHLKKGRVQAPHTLQKERQRHGVRPKKLNRFSVFIALSMVFGGAAGAASAQNVPPSSDTQNPPAPQVEMLGANTPQTIPKAVAFDDNRSGISVQNPDELKFVENIYLAFITSSSDRVNRLSEQGLTALGDTLYDRTSVEPAGVEAVDIEQGNLDFFPFIYWSISKDDPQLSPQAQRKVQRYLDQGGMILFDVRDSSGELGRVDALRDVVGALNIRPLDKVDEEHTLTRSFYLLSTLRGSYNYDRVWVEEKGEAGTESVSKVIIGENNWAAAWAGRTLVKGTRDHEMALRAGVNMVIYALTGDYKADQLHQNSILQKLGR